MHQTCHMSIIIRPCKKKKQVTFQQFSLSRVAILQCIDHVHQSLHSIGNDCIINVRTFRFFIFLMMR